ncbi:MAG: hypothetical protein MJ237_08020 [bacterium]|nr:hypothetical protein [bacterium]
MLTREVSEWLNKVKNCQYSFEDAMAEFEVLSKYLTIDELKMLKSKLEESYKI